MVETITGIDGAVSNAKTHGDFYLSPKKVARDRSHGTKHALVKRKGKVTLPAVISFATPNRLSSRKDTLRPHHRPRQLDRPLGEGSRILKSC